MYRAAAFVLIFLGVFAMLCAQDESNPDIETDWDLYSSDLYVRGDQTFIISLGTSFPLAFVNNGKLLENKIDPRIGGTGSLAYNYYLNSRFFLGGEVGGMFFPTIGGNTLFIIPLGLRGGMHFIAGRFEFPLSISIGMSWQNLLNMGYYGFYSRFAAAAFFRATSDWSFGITTQFDWLPEWTDEKTSLGKSKNVDGFFLNTTLSARYHF